KVAGDSAVFEPIGDRTSLRGRTKPLSILPGALNVIVIEREDRVRGRVVANPEEGVLPQIAWLEPRPFHVVRFRIGEPLSGKERACYQKTKQSDRTPVLLRPSAQHSACQQDAAD